ncbi:MAG: helix-turn-helix domain-containing protein [Clostridia bacterium]|nr:helix-turn-helix domain-containing protein [Clostridia bacterium]
MELQFACRLRKYRRERDMTQEELAQKIGISPQSVSKWERGDGLPDVTMLPRIAGCFDVTIDALLGYDDGVREEDIRAFISDVHGDVLTETEKLELCMKYRAKYPDNDRILHTMMWLIMYLEDKALREEYLPALRDCCETIIRISTEQVYRDNAVGFMCRICADHELEHWHGMCAQSYEAYAGEVLEKRLKSKNDRDGYLAQHDVNNLRILMHLFSRLDEVTDTTSPRGVKQMKFRIRILEALSEDGAVPDAWLGEYAHCHIRLACRCFADGNSDEGYFHAETALDAAEKWWSIPDGEYMKTGDTEIFGGCEVLRNEWLLRRGNGVLEDSSHDFLCFLGGRESLYVVMTNWPGFDPVRGQERFEACVRRAETLMNGAE